MSRFEDIMERRKGRRSLETNTPTYGEPQTRMDQMYGAQQAAENMGGSGFLRSMGTGARHIASALEPLQLPKDVFDAFVSSSLDPTTSLQDRIGAIEWGKYAPFGAQPGRPTTGREIASLIGIRDSRAQGVFGLAYDIGADPLLTGTFISAGSRIARLSGAVDTANDLQRFAKSVDMALSPVGAYRALPPVVRSAMEDRIVGAARSMANTQVFWRRSDDARTYGDLFVARRPALNMQLGEHGREIADVQALSRQAGSDLETRAIDLVSDALKTFYGEDTRSFWRKALDTVTRHGQAASRFPSRFNPIVRDSAFKRGYEYVKRHGLLTGDFSATQIDELREFLPIQRFVGLKEKDDAVNNFQLVVDEMRTLAKKYGDDPDEVEFAFRDFTGKITEADALMGYHVSGVEQVKERFFQAFGSQWTRAKGAEGSGAQQTIELWETALGKGLNGKWDDVANRKTFIPDDKDGFKTLQQVLDDSGMFRSLDFGAYLKGLQGGHMRRTYGMFMDNDTFDRFVSGVRKGRILPSSIMEENDVFKVLREKGVTREADLLEDYVKSLKPLLGTKQGTLITKYGMFDHLVANGVKPGDARGVLEELVTTMNKQLDDAALDIRQLGTKYEVDPHKRATIGSSFFKAREDLEIEVLERLGEIAHPIVSLLESAKAAKVKTSWSAFMEDTFTLARAHGWIGEKGTTDPVTRLRFVPVESQREVWGAFAGTWTHPMLKKELLTSMRMRGQREAGMQRVRSLITGGYLASPNVIAANIAGGVYTAAMSGISPLRMVGSMTSTLQDFWRASKDPKYSFDDLDELKQHIALNDISMVSQDIAKNMKSAEMLGRGVGLEAFESKFDNVMSAVEQQLRGPLGQRWAGLDGFQFVENWMKVAAFRARKQQLRELGHTREDIISSLAAEHARVAVFDYSEIPDSLRTLRDYGLMLFPGFTYFLGARTLRAAMERPGALAASDRMADAVNSTLMDEDERLAVYASMPEWLRDEQGVVIRKGEDRAGDRRYSIIPFNQLVPTATFYGNAWGESLASAGIWKPFVELTNAWVTGTGDAPFSAQYGQRVFEQGLPFQEKVGQSAGFLMNNLAPGLVRKLGSYTPGEGVDGILPSLMSRAPQVGPEGGDALYTMSELAKRRPQRDVWDQAISSLVRSPQVVSTEGPLMNVRKEFVGARRELDRELAVWKKRREQAARKGDQQGVQQATNEIMERREAFLRRWAEYLEAVNAAQ